MPFFSSSIGRLSLWGAMMICANVLAAGPVSAQVPSKFDVAFKQMLDAVKSNSYDQFMAQGDARFKTGFTKNMFADLNRLLGARLQQGYSTTYLTTMRQQSFTVYVWKLSINNAADDFLVTLFVADDHVSGFVAR
jgi:hypothetical protein